MISLSIKGIDNLSNNLKKVQRKLDKVPDEAYKVFVNNTPVRSGNARRKTKLKNKETIEANYPYAQRLDEGYSKQSPKGMINPTIAFIRKRVKEILAGK
jgi:hypothetical protein